MQLDLYWGSVFASRLRNKVFSVLFSFVNWILSFSWSRHRVIYSQNLNQNQRVLRRLIYIEPVLTSREECNVFADLFFKIYLCFSRDFVNQHVFSAAQFTFKRPKTHVRNATNLRTVCFEDYHYAFQETLSCDTRSLDLCVLFKFIFLYLLYIPPHSCAFHTFYFTPIFSGVYYHATYISYPWWALLLGNLIIPFNFSSQRPHLN